MNLYPLYLAGSFVIAAIALAVACLTFNRLGAWRREDLQRQAANEARNTEVTIHQVDQESRNGVKSLVERFNAYSAGVDRSMSSLADRIDIESREASRRADLMEGELRNAVQAVDSRLRVELVDQGRQLASLMEATRHLPTQADISLLRETMAKLHGDVAANGARTEGQAALLHRIDTSVQRIEEHHFRDR